ncbi:putative CCR4-associated factor 1 homolog 4 [Triticum aestivum]|uniref:putative CCR4-associated factor 1 homolog 4 n=1 Tax=Triticum aestivum TaxID=4565 RepID=UPI001D01B3A9|nr:putative CCR4-associated factor 1 homolog 4 [Triticum aestivum]
MTVAQQYALLKPLQVGIAVCDHQGQQVGWEFNLRDFCRLADPHDQKALDYLADRGVDLDMLGALLMGSGLIGAGHGRPLSWITYAGAYHVAYLLKIVTGGAPRPHDVAGFVGGMQYYLGTPWAMLVAPSEECNKVFVRVCQGNLVDLHVPVGLKRMLRGLHRRHSKHYIDDVSDNQMCMSCAVVTK